MFNIKKLLTLSATSLVLTLTPLQTSSATDYSYGYGSSYGHHGYNRHNRHHNYNRHHRPNYSSYGRRYYPSITYSYTPGYSSKHSGNTSSYSGGKDCRSTYKYQYDKHGNKTRINGTLCYDSYGKAYIVPGSRYVADSYH